MTSVEINVPYYLYVSAIVLLLGLWPARAFPPAPGVIVYGSVRDELGWALKTGEGEIVFTSGSRELRRVPLQIDQGVHATENYRALLPLDMEGSRDAYRSAILSQELPFEVHVEAGGQVFLPMEVFVGLQAPQEPAQEIRLDFTLGRDSDADGLPDEWEFWQLEQAGRGPGDADYGLDQLDGDGDLDGDGVSNRDEYNAGTLAVVFSDKFALSPKRVLEDGWLEFEFEGVVDKSYLFECSHNTSTWEPITVGIWGDREARQASYRPNRTGKVTIAIPPPVEHRKFFRVSVH